MFVNLVLFFYSLVHLASLQDKPYEFRPESRHIDINDGDDYFVGFDQIENKTAFGHCYYESATISGNYPILKPNSVQAHRALSDSSEGFKSYSGTGICAFVYYSVKEQAPLKWTFTAYDNYTGTNFTEEVTVSFFYNMPVYLNRITIVTSASFANVYLSGDTKLKKCSVGYNNTMIDLELTSIDYYTGKGILNSRLSSLGGGKCGYKVVNASRDDPDQLALFATDEQNKTYRHISDVVVVNTPSTMVNRTQDVNLGDGTFVICGKQSDGSSNNDQKFCNLYNPQGELVSHDSICFFNLDITTMEDLGTWKCTVGYNYIADSLEFTTQLVQREPKKVQTFTEDTPDYFIIGCRLINFVPINIMCCKFTRPDGKIFSMEAGGATAFYNSFSIDLDKGVCALEIMKPLRNEDQGSWKCEAVRSIVPFKSLGAFVDVVKSNRSPYSKHAKKNVRLGNSFEIDCMVPYSSDSCYIIAPNGTQYRPEDTLQITTGVCFYIITIATESDNGTWACRIAQRNGIPDDNIIVEVNIVELTVLYANAEAEENEEVELICNTMGSPIDYCRFVSPTGTSYSLRKDNQTYNKIDYKGRGLEYGDCGIKISEVKMEHSGTWNCYLNPGRDVAIKTGFQLKVSAASSNTSSAQSIGIGIGVAVVIVAGAGFIFYKYPKRLRCLRRNEEPVAEARTSDSTNSGEAINLRTLPTSYDAATS